jgi:hypothetical protein
MFQRKGFAIAVGSLATAACGLSLTGVPTDESVEGGPTENDAAVPVPKDAALPSDAGTALETGAPTPEASTTNPDVAVPDPCTGVIGPTFKANGKCYWRSTVKSDSSATALATACGPLGETFVPKATSVSDYGIPGSLLPNNGDDAWMDVRWVRNGFAGGLWLWRTDASPRLVLGYYGASDKNCFVARKDVPGGYLALDCTDGNKRLTICQSL